MARKKSSGQGPPVAFRPGPDLEQLVRATAAGRQVGESEMFKRLAALAVVGFDVRHYDLLVELASHMQGQNQFVRAVILAAHELAAATRLERKFAFDPARTAFVIDTVIRGVQLKGGSVPQKVLRAVKTQFGLSTNPYDDPGDTNWNASNKQQQQKLNLG